jgi:hypothetical protein
MSENSSKRQDLRVILLSKNLVETVIKGNPERVEKYPKQAYRLIKFVQHRKRQLRQIGKSDIIIKK